MALFLFPFSFFLTPPSAQSQERWALIVSGASGGEKYAESHERWRARLTEALSERYQLGAEQLIVLTERADDTAGRATSEGVRRAFTTLRGRVRRDDLLLIVLIGHGTFDGAEAKFNLVGPDLRADDWAELVRALPCRVILVNTTSASFPFLEHLSARNRIVITATDSAMQRYETIFPEFFAEALSDPAGDLDKNGRMSLWEAFAFASARVKRWYEERGQLPTERALLDDNGDGVGKEAGAPGSDGALARNTYLEPEPTARITGADGLLKQRSDLEARLEELKAKKASMPADAYEKELEALLIELAKIGRLIRAKS